MNGGLLAWRRAVILCREVKRTSPKVLPMLRPERQNSKQLARQVGTVVLVEGTACPKALKPEKARAPGKIKRRLIEAQSWKVF